MLTVLHSWCRLCAKEDGNQVDVFVKNENCFDIVQAITKFFLITITPYDETPVMICKCCYQYISDLMKFAEHVQKVEAMFSNIIFENISLVDMTSLRFHYGLSESDMLIKSVKKNSDQSTDTTDLVLEFIQKTAEMMDTTNSPSDNVLNVKIPESNKTDCENESMTKKVIASKSSTAIDDENNDSNHKTNDKRKNKEPKKIKTETKQTNFSSMTLKCEKCSKDFTRKTVLHYHMKTHHPPDDKIKYSRVKCDKQFRTEKRTLKHEVVHLPIKSKPLYPCEYCDKKFTTLASVQTHIRSIHFGERPFICEVCGKSFATKGALSEHHYTHVDDTPFQCSKCPKKFKHIASLKKHEDIHNDTTYVCPNCGLVLNTKRTLQMHMVVHSEQKKYKCNFCGNEFKRSKALKNHLILHTGLKPYNCPFCDKTFANGSNFRSHKKKAHPNQLAALEAAGKTHRITNIPKLEQLKACQQQ